MLESLMTQLHRRRQGFPDEPYDPGRRSWACVHCFKAIDGPATGSIGKRNCAWHPLAFDAQNNAYPCCGYSPALSEAKDYFLQRDVIKFHNGCTPADHVPTELWELSFSCKEAAGGARLLALPWYLFRRNNAAATALVPSSSAASPATAALQAWTSKHASLLSYVYQYARCAPAFHATVSPTALKSAQKRAESQMKREERGQSLGVDELSWVPYQSLPEAPEEVAVETQVISQRHAYVAQLLVALPNADETAIGCSYERYSEREKAMGKALENETVSLAVVKIAEDASKRRRSDFFVQPEVIHSGV